MNGHIGSVVRAPLTLFLCSSALGGCLRVGPLPQPEHDLRLDHELVGTIWRSSDWTQVSERDVVSDLRRTEVVLIGEKHDNVDHHALQGWLIRQLRPSAVAFEMLDEEDDVTAREPLALAKAVDWENSGWPPFEEYAPVFVATMDVDAAVVAAHPSRATLKASMRGELEPDPTLPLHIELSDVHKKELADLIHDAHCGHASDKVVSMMISGQRLKDAWMARSLDAAEGRAVLIAGNGHAVRGRGVPLYLQRPSQTVALREVSQGEADPKAYGTDADYVWFTARVDEVDPCERFKEQLQKMKQE
ncbi:MAG: putative iron-regulated protein [Kiritimatiellia bacterium]|jgi:uncharacterized iron-regulated protein